MNETIVRAFFDEAEQISRHIQCVRSLEKTARGRSYVSDFLGGVDPTGGSTFQYGMQDVEQGAPHSGLRRAVGTAGGVVGGAAVVPAAIGGLIGAVKGVGGGLGGVGKGFATGVSKPFTKIYRAARASSALKALESGNRLMPGQVRSLETFATKEMPGGGMIARALPTLQTAGSHVGRLSPVVREAVGRLAPETAGRLRKHVGGHLSSGIATLGTSGIIGGGSAALQYGKGRAAAEKYLGKEEQGG